MSKVKQATLSSFKEFFTQNTDEEKLPTSELMPLGKRGEGDDISPLKAMQRQLAVEAEAAGFKGVYACVLVEEK